jgi:Transcription factor WhiB
MTIMAGQAANVTRLPARELSRLVMAATRRPCAAYGANPEDWFRPEPRRRDYAGEQAYAAECERYEYAARALCRFCPVELACLERAIQQEGARPGHGVAGGTAPWQRQAIKASRGMAVAR